MRRVQQRKKDLGKMRTKDFAATLNPLAEDGLGLIDLAAHIRVLRALARKQKVNGSGIVRAGTRLHALGVALRERLNSVGNIVDNCSATVRESATPHLQSPGNIGQMRALLRSQMLGEIVSRLLEGLF